MAAQELNVALAENSLDGRRADLVAVPKLHATMELNRVVRSRHDGCCFR